MMPHNGQPTTGNVHGMRPQQRGFPDTNLFNLDSSAAAKQMAALSAANNARMANSRGGTNSGSIGGIGMQPGGHDPQYGGSLPQTNSAPFFDTNSMSSSNPAVARPQFNNQTKTRAQGFLMGLANVMAKRNTPLPPQITGVPTPTYDHNTSPFKVIELSPEMGQIRIGGKDVDVFKLWAWVLSVGGSQVCNWALFASQSGLPDELPQPHGTGATTSAHALQACYDLLLGPFEILYKHNIGEQQRRAQMSAKQGTPQTPLAANRTIPPNNVGSVNNFGSGMNRPPNMPNNSTGMPSPSTPFLPNSTGLPTSGPSQSPAPGPLVKPETTVEEIQGLKRKYEHEDASKRSRQKTGSEPPNVDGRKRVRMQHARRKIEYIPLAREVDTYGGRDLRTIMDTEIAPIPGRDPPLKEMTEWGTIDTDALVLSIRSRIGAEMSYALTTLAILSTMKGQTPGSGFPIHQCGDLFDELLDLMEDLAFEGAEDQFEIAQIDLDIYTHRQLTKTVYDGDAGPFVPPRRQGDADSSQGLKQRSGNLIVLVMTIVRNLTVVPENNDYISRKHRLVDIALRLCRLTSKDGQRTAMSPALSLSDVITVRKDTLTILSCIAHHVVFSDPTSPSLGTLNTATRIFQLVSSYLVDPIDSVSPTQYLQLTSTPLANHAPPALADLALDVFTRLGQLDSNRQVFSKAIPHSSIFRLLNCLVRRLPLLDGDFQAIARESWISFMEKIVLAVYSIVFFASPSLKQAIKADRTLAIKSVLLRMTQKFLTHPSPEARGWYAICSRRAVETLKILDDGENAFDVPKNVAPTMSFGMGWGDSVDGDVEQGSGLLASHRNVAWDMLMLREVLSDEVMFNELESLSRVECAT